MSIKPPVLIADSPEELVQRSLLRDAMRRFLMNRLAMLGAILLSLLVVMAVLADVVAPLWAKRSQFLHRALAPF